MFIYSLQSCRECYFRWYSFSFSRTSTQAPTLMWTFKSHSLQMVAKTQNLGQPLSQSVQPQEGCKDLYLGQPLSQSVQPQEGCKHLYLGQNQSLELAQGLSIFQKQLTNEETRLSIKHNEQLGPSDGQFFPKFTELFSKQNNIAIKQLFFLQARAKFTNKFCAFPWCLCLNFFS